MRLERRGRFGQYRRTNQSLGFVIELPDAPSDLPRSGELLKRAAKSVKP